MSYNNIDWYTYDFTLANSFASAFNVGVSIDSSLDVFPAFIVELQQILQGDKYSITDDTIDSVIAMIWKEFNSCNGEYKNILTNETRVILVKGGC